MRSLKLAASSSGHALQPQFSWPQPCPVWSRQAGRSPSAALADALRLSIASLAAALASPIGRRANDRMHLCLPSCQASSSSSSSHGSSSSGSDVRPSYRRVTVIRSQSGPKMERLRTLPTLPLEEDRSGGAQAPSVFVQPSAASQKPWLGFGGSFTEASAVTLQKLSADKRKEVLTAYFHPERGLGYNLGRIPIGSCDFSLYSWTCGDLVEGDPELGGFSIDRYKDAILPMLQEAAALSGEPITLMASPWSPPPWMKSRRTFHGDGRLLPRCRSLWAKHFVRFVQEMAHAGVPIWAVSVQNEPEAAQAWESCLYTAEEELIFVRDHLGPALREAGLADVKILVWDHNRDGMLERAAAVYNDPVASDFVWGVAYHWYGDARFESWPPRVEVPFEDRQRDSARIFELRGCSGSENVRRVAELRPEKHILFTEGCQELGGRTLESVLGDWKLGERYAMNIISDMNNGCEGWIDWNLCLDETGGPNHVGNLCVAPVICDTRTDRVLYQPSFVHLAHFSRFIKSGALRVPCSSSMDALEVTSFMNPDGSLAVVVLNQSEVNIDFWLKVAGNQARHQAVQLCAPARSIQTLVVDGLEDLWWRRLLPRAAQDSLANIWHSMGPKEPYQVSDLKL